MDEQKSIFVSEPNNQISYDECSFYTVQNIPGMEQPTAGSWDLRNATKEYLGHVDFSEKTVLELGPASGYLTFHIEKECKNITSIELSPENDYWDIVPVCKHDWKALERQHMRDDLQKVQNAYWFAHKAHQSKAKVIHSHINDIDPSIGFYDVSLMCSVLLHLQNPFVAMRNMLRLTNETAIITDLLPHHSRKSLFSLFVNLHPKLTH